MSICVIKEPVSTTYHFNSKDELIEVALEAGFAEHAAKIDAIATAHPEATGELLVALTADGIPPLPRETPTNQLCKTGARAGIRRGLKRPGCDGGSCP